ncbi:MAG: Asp-tRNA(Asn)/Glu-tRNA(Gln) amidotransferase subunit GatC [Verrucomicrobiota bacterium]|nr:Asp-tRNA(Asn)/Glu-tRNA(Gln) amidotransferase subunit GatC [Verrucomicrobiota bacterium]
MGEPIDVAYVANLARLRLSEEESALFKDQLRDVLRYVEKLSEIDLPATDAGVAMRENVGREDEARPGFTSEQALANAPQTARHLFIVPKVIE